MRIRKRLLVQSSSDPQLHRSEAAAPPHQPSDPPDQILEICSIIRTWIFPKNGVTQEKMKLKDLANDETLKEEEKKNTTNDIRRIPFSISDEEVSTKKILQPSSSSAQGSWPAKDNELVPLRKRNLDDDQTTSPNRMSEANMDKCGDIMEFGEVNGIIEDSGSGVAKKIKRGSVIMEGSRCSRVNGRGWRCCQPTPVGYSLCEHHLGKGRLRNNMPTSVRRLPNYMNGSVLSDGEPRRKQQDQPTVPLIVTKKRTRMVKARSINSLLTQI